MFSEMKRGFLKPGTTATEPAGDGTPASPTSPRSQLATQIPTDADPNDKKPFKEFQPSDPSRILSTNPRIVIADCALGYMHYLFLPPTNSNIVFLDSRQNVESIAQWPLWTQPPPTPPSSPLFAVRDSGEKGRGMFARRSIAMGELIMLERPVYVLLPVIHTEADTKTRSAIFAGAMADLSVETQASITSLRNAGSPLAVSHLHGQLLTNFLPVAMPGAERQHSGIFPSLSRANHDCSPNTYYFFNTTTFTGQFHAVRPIAEDEEITIAYTILADSQKARQGDLSKKYCFQCTCATCSLPNALVTASDKRRCAVGTYLKDVKDSADGILPNTSLARFTELIHWAEDEGLIFEACVLMVAGAKVAGREGNRSEASQLVRSALKYKFLLEGAESPAFADYARKKGLTLEELLKLLQSLI